MILTSVIAWIAKLPDRTAMRADNQTILFIGLQFVQKNGYIIYRLFTYPGPLVLKRWMNPLVRAKSLRVG